MANSTAKKILIVEDDKFLRELIIQKLLKEGYNISEAIDGEEAIRVVKAEKPDLILLDLILPKASGFEVLAKIKEDPLISQIPIIILSNLGQKDDVEKGLKLTKKDLKELDEEIKRNRQQRMDFVNLYSAWLKKTPNKVWSAQHKKFLGS